MELTDELVKNMVLFANIVVEILFYHMNKNGLVFHVDIT